MFNDFKLAEGRPVYLQIKDYMKRLIVQGAIQADRRLPATRELAALLGVGRGTIIAAYAELEADGFAYTVQGKGSFATSVKPQSGSGGEEPEDAGRIGWEDRISDYALMAEELDLMKRGIRASKGTISFTSIAPDEKLFDLDSVKRAFLDRMSMEGHVLLNYGYAKGYKPLIDYLLDYMARKGVDTRNQDMLITSGFTEGFDLVLSTVKKVSGRVLCENPTHNTAIKNLKLHGFQIRGVPMEADGLNLEELKEALDEGDYDLVYLVPSYHNPTGTVMSLRKRLELMELMNRRGIPVIEDGFNEELRYSGSHVAPLAALGSAEGGVVYIGSFSKVLFPGLRVGWVLGDRRLIGVLESVKRARSIHTSTLDQSLLYQYLHNGNLEKYLRRARAEYKRKYELTLACCREKVPFSSLSGDGGLHLFMTFEPGLNTRDLLAACQQRGVIFTPGDSFFTDGGGQNTLRLGFSRVSDENIRRGVSIIGEEAKRLLKNR
ncbi:2-aminoadipate transaminase [compost metagenome]|uniref:GntR family transcriptional regulator n=1 Tax=Paenibacillus stellifer TaxID=169760 RepID=A0A089LN30_9BACL|nr:PLP-dependent aminotransferase family protein [Paenibacillus stellifer]AIQ62916.1 GntR family transcriptional regulator [Paenibacillus stellifer]